MFRNVTVLGAGTMGKSIAKLFLQNDLTVCLFDINNEILEAAQLGFFKDFDSSRKITFEADLQVAVCNADLIIESVVEDLAVKRSVYEQIALFAKKDVVLCSNTSSYSLEALSKDTPLCSQMLIAHFFNPAEIVPLVEVVQSELTKDGICDQVVIFLKTCGKVPVILHKDYKGFIANRLQAAILREACSIVENGVADVADIDKVMVEGIGFRWAFEGPFSIVDLGGIDVWKKVCENLLPDLCDCKEVPGLISDKIDRSELGVKTGIGFYSYNALSKELILQAREKHLLELSQIRFGQAFL